MNIATAAVLLINPEIIATVNKKMKIVNQGLLPPNLYKYLAKTSKKPVLTSERLSMNIDPMIITALLLKPDTAVSISITLNKTNTATANKEVTSKGKISKLKKIIVSKITDIRII